MRTAALICVCAALTITASAEGNEPAPGAPGARHTWAPADKHGFGTAHQLGGNAYFTLRQASLTEIYYRTSARPRSAGCSSP